MTGRGLRATVAAGAAFACVAMSLTAACSSGPSAAVRDRRVCAAYETFWDTDYAGGAVPAPLASARDKLLSAIARRHDKRLGEAARGVVDGELSAPAFAAHETAASYDKKLASLSTVQSARLFAVDKDDAIVEAKCDALGRHING